jgi:hypothetical protein
VVLAAKPLGEPDVVGVSVGEDERPDVGHRSAHGRQLAGIWP